MTIDSTLAVPKIARRVRGDDLKLRPGRNIIRGTSGRAYDFEAVPAEAIDTLDDVAAVYIYARDMASAEAHARGDDATAQHFSLGLAGEAHDVAKAARLHAADNHLAGFGFDVMLLVRVDNPSIRAEILEDVVTFHRPVLNDLLRRQHGGLSG